MAYNAIIHGANGILYWGMKYTPQPSSFISNLYKVTNELSDMLEILSTPDSDIQINKRYHELMYSVDAGVELIVKEVNSNVYLLTVNSDKNPVKVSLSNIGRYESARVLKENRTITLENGEFTDTYKPFDVHIYELK